MNNIEKLLKDIPVEWKTLGEVCDIRRGRVISKKYLADNIGEYPVYSSQTINNGQIGKISTYDFDGEYTTWTTDGAYAGTVFYRNGKFSITNICGLISPRDNEKLLVKFITYWLQIEAKKHVAGGSGNPKLMSNVMANIPIPIPPLQTQEKIVEKLDKMINYTTELRTELRGRKQQYEYYRDYLLSEEQLQKRAEKLNIEKEQQNSLPSILQCKKLWEVTIWDKKFNGVAKEKQEITHKYHYYLASQLKDIARKDGDVKILTTNISNTYTTRYLAGSNLASGEVVCLPWGGNPVIQYYKGDFITSDNRIATSKNTDLLSNRYLYYFLLSKLNTISSYYRGSGIKHPDMVKVLDMDIIIPSLPIQNRIVNVLDKFSSLLENTEGLLPKEIEQRQKQYEYYREKLLSFGEADPHTHTHTHTHTH